MMISWLKIKYLNFWKMSNNIMKIIESSQFSLDIKVLKKKLAKIVFFAKKEISQKKY